MSDEQNPDTEPVQDAPTGDEPGNNNGDETSTAKREFTQVDVDRIVKERLERDRKKREAEAAAERQEAEKKALKEKEEFKSLSEQQETELGTLRPKAELADQLTERITQLINAEIADWPDEVKAMAPGEGVSPLAMLDWVDQARPLAQKLADPGPQPGNGRKPKPSGSTADQERVRELDAQSARFVNRNF